MATETITFEDAPEGELTTQYAEQGVTFSNTRVNGFPIEGGSGSKNIISSDTKFYPTSATALVATFSTPVSSVSIVALDVGDRGARIEAYAGDVLVDSDEVFGEAVGGGFSSTLSVTGSNITSIRLYQPRSTGSGDGVAFDDLTFVTSGRTEFKITSLSTDNPTAFEVAP